VYPFLFSGRLTVAKQSTDGYTTYLLKHNFCLYLTFAVLFICFLQKAGILLDIDGRKRIDDNALVALTLMIAASKPSEKEIMIKVILNLLNETR
jgi:hypothetical protein